MLQQLNSYLNSLVHLIFPHHCNGCGSDVLQNNQLLCAKCLMQLPETNFTTIENNSVEKIFIGRLKITNATAAYYFSKNSLIQHLIHQLKYNGNKDIGFYLGKLLGRILQQSNLYNHIDVIVPLPLNSKRQFKRGYNQAEQIALGVAAVLQKPVNTTSIVRNIFTETQTHHTRIERLQNMDGVFVAANSKEIIDKNVLLIDDIITTGATLEACGKIILQNNAASLSIATLAYTT